MHGILNINKPAGLTSRDVVNRIQRLVRPSKTGHAGTLDPLATGVLVCPVGPGTKLIEFIQRQPKTYLATFLLGKESPTEDIEGDVRELTNPPVPSRLDVEAQIGRFVGTIEQRPPAYSALKVAGKRAYDLARQGKDVQLAPRSVEIHELTLLRYEYPELELQIHCGGGTYVRSLGRDLAQALGTSAVMSLLTRTAIGEFTIATAVDPAALTPDNLLEYLLPVETAVQSLNRVTIRQSDVIRLAQGKPIDVPTEKSTELAAFDSRGNLIAILTRSEEGHWRSVKNFAPLHI